MSQLLKSNPVLLTHLVKHCGSVRSTDSEGRPQSSRLGWKVSTPNYRTKPRRVVQRNLYSLVWPAELIVNAFQFNLVAALFVSGGRTFTYDHLLRPFVSVLKQPAVPRRQGGHVQRGGLCLTKWK